MTLIAMLVAWTFLTLPNGSSAVQGATVNSVVLDYTAEFGGDRGVELDPEGTHICSGQAHCGHLALVTAGSFGGTGFDWQHVPLASKPLRELPTVPVPPPPNAAS